MYFEQAMNSVNAGLLPDVDTDPQNDCKQEVDDYKRWVEKYDEIHVQNLKTLDERILLVGAGTLGLSLTFISDLVELDSAQWMQLLILSWIALASAIIVNLWGFRYVTTRKYYLDRIDTLRQMTGVHPYEETGADFEGAKTRDQARSENVEKFNKVSFLLLMLGLASMVFFVSINALNQSGC